MYIAFCCLSFFLRIFFKHSSLKHETVPEIQGSYYGTSRMWQDWNSRRCFTQKSFLFNCSLSTFQGEVQCHGWLGLSPMLEENACIWLQAWGLFSWDGEGSGEQVKSGASQLLLRKRLSLETTSGFHCGQCKTILEFTMRLSLFPALLTPGTWQPGWELRTGAGIHVWASSERSGFPRQGKSVGFYDNKFNC